MTAQGDYLLDATGGVASGRWLLVVAGVALALFANVPALREWKRQRPSSVPVVKTPRAGAAPRRSPGPAPTPGDGHLLAALRVLLERSRLLESQLAPLGETPSLLRDGSQALMGEARRLLEPIPSLWEIYNASPSLEAIIGGSLLQPELNELRRHIDKLTTCVHHLERGPV